MSPLFQIHDLQVAFPTRRGFLKIIDSLSLNLNKEEVVTVLGESGSGKSVLAHAIMRLLDTQARVNGAVRLKGIDLLRQNEKTMEQIRGNHMALIMQNPDQSFNPVFKIGIQLIEPLLIHKKTGKSQARVHLGDTLRRLGFEHPERLFGMYPHELSGGMKQRLLIAAALATRPEMIIADEPTKGLDEPNRNLVIRELEMIRKTYRCSLILITHDIIPAQSLADRVAVMYAGEIIEISPAGTFFSGPLHPYARNLLDASPEKGFQPIRGQSPNFHELPGGCRFHPRCQQKIPCCSRRKPKMIHTEKGEVKCFLY